MFLGSYIPTEIEKYKLKAALQALGLKDNEETKLGDHHNTINVQRIRQSKKMGANIWEKRLE